MKTNWAETRDIVRDRIVVIVDCRQHVMPDIRGLTGIQIWDKARGQISQVKSPVQFQLQENKR
jgi:hypothetical protein